MDSGQRRRAERRLVAILAADVVGYSRLIGADEEGTLGALRVLRQEIADPQIEENGGRIVKTTGDGLLVEFGSVVDAVRCAVEIQRTMAARNASLAADQQIQFRIGVHQGDIVVEDGDIFGDGVNIAARLEALAPPGGICVSARVREDTIGKLLDIGFEDMGDQALKNIARPIRVYRVARKGFDPSALLGSGGFSLPDKPSIAVLPFNNMSADPDQEYFADGIAEDITTALARYPSLFVIARNSAFTYKGRALDIKEVSRELGVRYVLEGSMRKSGTRVRITAQLIEGTSGTHVWAHRYDRDLSDIFAVQDEITDEVTTAIAPAIADAERHRAMRRPPDSLDAWGAYQRGLWHLGKFNRSDNDAAQTFFQQAIELDSAFAGGYGGLAAAKIQAANVFFTQDLGEVLSTAEGLARHAVGLDVADAEARTALGRVLLTLGDFAGARAEVEDALELSPNLASAHGILGATLIFSGRPKEGLLSLQRGIRLDPRDPRSGVSVNQIVIGLYLSGDYEGAVTSARRVISAYPDHPLVYRWLAAALGQLGRSEEAGAALAKATAVAPASFDVYVRKRVPWHRPEDHEHMLEGLRKAGWSA